MRLKKRKTKFAHLNKPTIESRVVPEKPCPRNNNNNKFHTVITLLVRERRVGGG